MKKALVITLVFMLLFYCLYTIKIARTHYETVGRSSVINSGRKEESIRFTFHVRESRCGRTLLEPGGQWSKGSC